MTATAFSPETLLPLTEAQAALWYAQRLDRANPLFNTALHIEIAGPLDGERFRRAVDMAMGEAEALALRIVETADGPRQVIDPGFRPLLEVIDLSSRPAAREDALAAILADAGTPIDPAREPMAVQRLYRLGPDRAIFYQRIHHIVIDGYGVTILNRRIAELYQTDGAGGTPLAPLTQALDEDAAYLTSDKRDTDAAYWRETLAGLTEVVGMAPGRAVSAAHYHRARRVLTDRQREALQALAQRFSVTWPDIVTALSALYTQRFAQTGEVVLGVAHMGRFGNPTARVPMMVMNVLPLRLPVDPEAPLADFIVDTSRALARLRRHGRYRGEQIRRDLGLIGGQRRLYGPLVNILPFDTPLAIAGLDLEASVHSTGPVDDITLTFRGDGQQSLALDIDANPDLYSAQDTEAHADRFLAFIASAADAQTPGDIPLATRDEAEAILARSQGETREIPETTLTALIAQSLRRTPDATALVFEGASLTYAELDARSAALAAQLRGLGVGPESRVAIALPRSLDLVVGLIAILRAGGVYLPLDLSHPPERLGRILAAAAPTVLLAKNAIAGTEVPVLSPDDWRTDGPAPALEAGPGNAAYVIYTSGSTGEPKGVLVEHRAIVNRLLWMRDFYGFGSADRILQKTPMTFDVSVWEFFLPFISGATLIIAPPEAHRDPAAIAALIRREAITTLHFVPSMLSVFLSEPRAKGLRIHRVFTSGEELTADLRDRFHATLSAELHNLYGPTEAAVDVSYWPASADDDSVPVPIGLPVWNTALHVLDERLRPLPIGVAGDLYLGGIQLARGYLGRPDLTSDRFIPSPFTPGGRLYKTGDVARRRADGAVLYLGRSDHQVKLRGLRIELGEIETAILSSGLAAQTVVTMREDRPGDPWLVAYLVPEKGFEQEALRRHLLARLPDYMVPSAFVMLDAMPVSANGKLDRSRLPAPRYDRGAGQPLSSDTETLLARLFAETLGLEALPGADADFFALGGSSLSAVTLLLAIREALGRDPGLGALFASPTVAALAAHIDGETKALDSGTGPLLVLNRGEPHIAPLFVVHPAGGLSWCYRDMARALGPRRPVYGLQAPALDPAVPVPESLDALAEDYLSRIRALEAPGPIHLLGWSVGGLIAHAMATRLAAEGERPGLVMMLDSYPADCWRAEPEPDAGAALRALLAIAGYDPDAHPELDSRDAVVGFLRNGESPLASLPASVLDGVVRVVTETNRLVRAHHHQKFPGTVTHVRAGLDHRDRPALTPDLWRAYAEDLDSLSVPFLHPQLTSPAATAAIVPALRARLDAIDKEFPADAPHRP